MSDLWDDYFMHGRSETRRLPITCKDHPRYQVKRKTRVPCEMCWRMWIEKNP